MPEKIPEIIVITKADDVMPYMEKSMKKALAALANTPAGEECDIGMTYALTPPLRLLLKDELKGLCQKLAFQYGFMLLEFGWNTQFVEYDDGGDITIDIPVIQVEVLTFHPDIPLQDMQAGRSLQ